MSSSGSPGQPLFLKNLNCGCINPYYDQVLNPAAWTNPANGTFGPATGTYYGDYRSARRPQENANLGRNFRIKEHYNLQIRAEFVNIFNRTQIGNPSTPRPPPRLARTRRASTPPDSESSMWRSRARRSHQATRRTRWSANFISFRAPVR